MHYKVFLDTNVFISYGYSFHNGAFNRLREYASSGILELQINSVVYQEVRRHIKDNIGQSVNQLNKALKSQSFAGFRAQAAYAEKLSKVDEKEWIQYTLDEFDSLLSDLKAEKISAEGIDGEKIYAAFVNMEPPFDQDRDKKDEFPDAITIQTIINEIDKLSSTDGKAFKEYSVGKNADALIYCIVSKDIAFTNAFETVKNDRIDDQDILLFDNLYSLLQMLLANKIAERLVKKLDQGFGQDEIENIIHDFLMSSAYIVDGDNGLSDDSGCVDTKDVKYYSYVSEITVDDEIGKIQVKIDFDIYAKVRIKYSYLNENESHWDKEDNAYLWTVYTNEDAWYETSKELTISLVIDTNNDIDGDNWIITDMSLVDDPEDIYICSDNLVEVISSENRY